MSDPSDTRFNASVALLVLLPVAGYILMIIAINQTYFPDKPTGHLWGTIAAICALAAYLIATIWRGRFWWRDENEVDDKPPTSPEDTGTAEPPSTHDFGWGFVAGWMVAIVIMIFSLFAIFNLFARLLLHAQ